jgi:hypothetical protein
MARFVLVPAGWHGAWAIEAVSNGLSGEERSDHPRRAADGPARVLNECEARHRAGGAPAKASRRLPLSTDTRPRGTN